MNTDTFPPPVNKLLTLGDARNLREWPNYLELGLGPEHISDLVRMATDEELNRADPDSLEVWAPLHAWRALGQLRAAAAIEPLMRLFDKFDDKDYDDDWAMSELPTVYGMIGPAAISALAIYLADQSHRLYARATAADSLSEIGKLHPEARPQCVAVLTRQLEHFAENDPTLNGFILAPLLDLKAVESATVMERAFAAKGIDTFIAGDWEDVQVQLGLKVRKKDRKRN